MKKTVLINVFFLISIFLLTAALVYAAVVPAPPDTLNKISSGRYDDPNTTITVQAQAGNVTELTIIDTRSTQAWQGYYGNVTGTITLDDANNETLYSWDLANPTGEVYAANDTQVTWGNIKCFNFTSNLSDGWTMNATTFEDSFYINYTDRDGLEETFNDTYSNTTGFKVGDITINDLDACPMVTTYVDEAYQTTNFREVLLTDNVSIVFAALLEDSRNGFQSAGTDLHDFQMVVVENGHPGFETTTTPYYFFVELA